MATRLPVNQWGNHLRTSPPAAGSRPGLSKVRGRESGHPPGFRKSSRERRACHEPPRSPGRAQLAPPGLQEEPGARSLSPPGAGHPRPAPRQGPGVTGPGPRPSAGSGCRRPPRPEPGVGEPVRVYTVPGASAGRPAPRSVERHRAVPGPAPAPRGNRTARGKPQRRVQRPPPRPRLQSDRCRRMRHRPAGPALELLNATRRARPGPPRPTATQHSRTPGAAGGAGRRRWLQRSGRPPPPRPGRPRTRDQPTQLTCTGSRPRPGVSRDAKHESRAAPWQPIRGAWLSPAPSSRSPETRPPAASVPRPQLPRRGGGRGRLPAGGASRVGGPGDVVAANRRSRGWLSGSRSGQGR
nr:proline-rich protein 2-like [Chelonoidis abingdonii]